MGTTQLSEILEGVVKKNIWRGWLSSRAPHKYFVTGEVAELSNAQVWILSWGESLNDFQWESALITVCILRINIWELRSSMAKG